MELVAVGAEELALELDPVEAQGVEEALHHICTERASVCVREGWAWDWRGSSGQAAPYP